MNERRITPDERFHGEGVVLRLVTAADCTPRYVSWLNDPEVGRYLETRWTTHDLASVRAFVAQVSANAHSYLFAIEAGMVHIGNIKVGPINERHAYADVSYFLGERSVWGRGYATDAIRTASWVGFERLGLHRLQAGIYAGNVGSGRALEKAGYRLEGRMVAQLRGVDGWEDHLWYGLPRERWVS